MMKAHLKMKPTTIRKYRAIQKRYKELYDIDRLRHDDCVKKLLQEFFIQNQETIYRILRTDLPKEEKPLSVVEKEA